MGSELCLYRASIHIETLHTNYSSVGDIGILFMDVSYMVYDTYVVQYVQMQYGHIRYIGCMMDAYTYIVKHNVCIQAASKII